MSLPGDTLSGYPIVGNFIGARALNNPDSPSYNSLKDYENGGVGFNDASEGLLVKIWYARIEQPNKIYIGADGVEEELFYEGGGEITEISLAFDQNMRPAFSFVEDGEAKFSWYSTLDSEQVVTNYGPSVKNPRVSLDDKRSSQFNNSDIILAYIRNDVLYYRQQRDRYEIERILAVVIKSELVKIGMGDQNRFQFQLKKSLL